MNVVKDPTTVTPADLVKVWSLSRSSEYRQMTLRVPANVFFKLQALERMFPGRSRNEMASDLLTTALDQFADGLNGAFLGEDSEGNPVFEETAASVQFWTYFREAQDIAVKTSEPEASEDAKDKGKANAKVLPIEVGGKVA